MWAHGLWSPLPGFVPASQLWNLYKPPFVCKIRTMRGTSSQVRINWEKNICKHSQKNEKAENRRLAVILKQGRLTSLQHASFASTVVGLQTVPSQNHYRQLCCRLRGFWLSAWEIPFQYPRGYLKCTLVNYRSISVKGLTTRPSSSC